MGRHGVPPNQSSGDRKRCSHDCGGLLCGSRKAGDDGTEYEHNCCHTAYPAGRDLDGPRQVPT